MRRATIERNTQETRIAATVDLDGSGTYQVSTGIGFLDHMLEQLSRHSLIDITLKAEGDLHIDYHHTTEDSGIVIGQAVAEALGERKGIWRYGQALISDGRDPDPGGARCVEPPLSHLEGGFQPRQARHHGHRVVQGVVSGLCPARRPDAARGEPLRHEQSPYRRVLL